MSTCLSKCLIALAFLLPSFTAAAFSCVEGSPGHCLIGVDKNNLNQTNLIDPAALVSFCDNNQMFCYGDNKGNTTVMGRYLEDDVFILANNQFGGPDLIFDNKTQAQQFAREFGKVATKPAYFYIRHGDYPVLGMVAIGYFQTSNESGEEIKLLFLPNEKGDTGEGHSYVPVDMMLHTNPWGRLP